MSEDSYKQRTKRLGFPVLGHRDRILPEVELRKWQMVENLFMSTVHGRLSCFFEEGDLSVQVREDGLLDVVLVATGQNTSAKGLVGGAYFEALPRLIWDGLENTGRHILYISGSNDTFADPALVKPVSSVYALNQTMLLKVATLDCNGDSPILDKTPAGRLHLDDLATHIDDSINPHGEVQVQDGLIVNRLRVDGEVEVGGVTFGADKVMQAFAGIAVAGIVDFESNGKDGILVEAGQQVAFVQLSVRSGGNGKLGCESIGYYGQDENVKTPKQFMFYNTGSAGVLLRALVVTVGKAE